MVSQSMMKSNGTVRAEEFGHEVAFASAFLPGLLGPFRDPLSQQLVIGLNGWIGYRQGAVVYEE